MKKLLPLFAGSTLTILAGLLSIQTAAPDTLDRLADPSIPKHAPDSDAEPRPSDKEFERGGSDRSSDGNSADRAERHLRRTTASGFPGFELPSEASSAGTIATSSGSGQHGAVIGDGAGVRVQSVGHWYPYDSTPKEPAQDLPPTTKSVGAWSGLDRPATLEWLQDHQSDQGYWSARDFQSSTKRTGARLTWNREGRYAGLPGSDVGSHELKVRTTALALLSFSTSGFDHKSAHYKATCSNALRFLRRMQATDGAFRVGNDPAPMRTHAIATMALAELYGLTMDRAVKPLADRALDYLLKSRVIGSVWGVDKRSPCDTLSTGWAILALESAIFSGLEFDQQPAYDAASDWLDQVTNNSGGTLRVGMTKTGGSGRLQRPEEYGFDALPLLEAVYIAVKLQTGKMKVDDKRIQSFAKIVADESPKWKPRKFDFTYWYWGSLALYRVGGESWKKWHDTTIKVLNDNQRGYVEDDKPASAKTLAEHGSWDALDAWSSEGGRVYATALNGLTRHIHYRYIRGRILADD